MTDEVNQRPDASDAAELREIARALFPRPEPPREPTEEEQAALEERRRYVRASGRL